ncbi:MAG: DUF881 domain-containing protein [Euzebyales bacterium]|nr:DUF881 domain-containing protein [Euzebyales bacterium]
MTSTAKASESVTEAGTGSAVSRGQPAQRSPALRMATALACGLLGFLLVTQVRAGEGLGERLDIEREEDLAQLLSDLTTQSDRLQEEITDLRLTLLAFENSAQSEQLALQSLRRRLRQLRVLAGTVPVEGEGVTFTISDPDGVVGQDLLVDTVQELRDAGAEAIAVGNVRLVASSAFTTRNGRRVIDGQPLDPPYVITAVGPGETIAKALAIPGGAVDSLEAVPQATAEVQVLAQVTVPARDEPVPFLFGEPLPPEDTG